MIKRFDKKENFGITLVALVVTIIILLILAGITISQLTNSGLLENAKLAHEKHENATQKEDDILKQYENAMNGGKISSDRDIDIQQLKNQIKQELMQEMSGDACPTGTIIAYYGDTAPTGYLKCDGTSYNISDYTALATLINTTTGSYGTEEAGKFKVPNLTGKFLKGNTSAGASEDAGLPDIEGRFYAYSYGNGSASDAFSGTVSNAGCVSSGSTASYNYDIFDFKASDSNAIYGNSSTVTPENVSVVYCIKF